MILLAGVAHVIDLKRALTQSLTDFQPAAVAIELDPDRMASLVEKAKGGRSEKGGGRSGAPLFLRLWANVQERLASELGEIPGAEMLTAVEVARELKVPLFLIDDPLNQVAPRLASALSPKERVRLLVSSVIALFIPANLVKKELEEYSQDRESYVGAMREQFPTVARVLIDERNLHMAQRVQEIARSYERVAVVVGDAHVSGLQSLLQGSGELQVHHLADVK